MNEENESIKSALLTIDISARLAAASFARTHNEEEINVIFDAMKEILPKEYEGCEKHYEVMRKAVLDANKAYKDAS